MKNLFKLFIASLVLALGSNAMANGFGHAGGAGYGGGHGGRGNWIAPAIVGAIAGAVIYEAARPAPIYVQQQPSYGYIPPAVLATQYPRYPQAQIIYPQATASVSNVPQCMAGYQPFYTQQPDGTLIYQGCR